jgi:hypothetical protein
MCIDYNGLDEVADFIKDHRRLYTRVVRWLSWDKDKQDTICPFVRKKAPGGRIDIGKKYDRYYCENTCGKIFPAKSHDVQILCPCFRRDVHETTIEIAIERMKELLL